MRDGSTLIHGLLPDSRDCLSEEPLFLPANSRKNTWLQFLILFVITIGFDVCFDYMAFGFFIVLMQAHFDRLNPKNVGHHSGDLLVAFVLFKTILPLAFCLISLALALYQAVLFARHWISIRTAENCYLADAARIRAKFRASLPLTLAFLPVSLAVGGVCLLADFEQACEAWLSYLNYGKGQTFPPGSFRSPAGSHRFRMHLYYVTGAALSLSIMHVPAGLLVDSVSVLALPIVLFGPALVALVLPALIAAPYFQALRKIHNDA